MNLAEPVTVGCSIPDELICPLCGDLLTDAIMLPCCANSACDVCARDSLAAEKVCPIEDCGAKDSSVDDLIPNRRLRGIASKFRDEHPELFQRRPIVVTRQAAPPPPPPPPQKPAAVQPKPVDPPRPAPTAQEQAQADKPVLAPVPRPPSAGQADRRSSPPKKEEVSVMPLIIGKTNKRSPFDTDNDQPPVPGEETRQDLDKMQGKVSPSPIPVATSTRHSHKVEIPRQLMNEAIEDPLTAFNRLMAARDREKGISRHHYGPRAISPSSYPRPYRQDFSQPPPGYPSQSSRQPRYPPSRYGSRGDDRNRRDRGRSPPRSPRHRRERTPPALGAGGHQVHDEDAARFKDDEEYHRWRKEEDRKRVSTSRSPTPPTKKRPLSPSRVKRSPSSEDRSKRAKKSKKKRHKRSNSNDSDSSDSKRVKKAKKAKKEKKKKKKKSRSLSPPSDRNEDTTGTRKDKTETSDDKSPKNNADNKMVEATREETAKGTLGIEGENLTNKKGSIPAKVDGTLTSVDEIPFLKDNKKVSVSEGGKTSEGDTSNDKVENDNDTEFDDKHVKSAEESDKPFSSEVHQTTREAEKPAEKVVTPPKRVKSPKRKRSSSPDRSRRRSSPRRRRSRSPRRRSRSRDRKRGDSRDRRRPSPRKSLERRSPERRTPEKKSPERKAPDKMSPQRKGSQKKEEDEENEKKMRTEQSKFVPVVTQPAAPDGDSSSQDESSAFVFQKQPALLKSPLRPLAFKTGKIEIKLKSTTVADVANPSPDPDLDYVDALVEQALLEEPKSQADHTKQGLLGAEGANQKLTDKETEEKPTITRSRWDVGPVKAVHSQPAKSDKQSLDKDKPVNLTDKPHEPVKTVQSQPAAPDKQSLDKSKDMMESPHEPVKSVQSQPVKPDKQSLDKPVDSMEKSVAVQQLPLPEPRQEHKPIEVITLPGGPISLREKLKLLQETESSKPAVKKVDEPTIVPPVSEDKVRDKSQSPPSKRNPSEPTPSRKTAEDDTKKETPPKRVKQDNRRESQSPPKKVRRDSRETSPPKKVRRGSREGSPSKRVTRDSKDTRDRDYRRDNSRDRDHRRDHDHRRDRDHRDSASDRRGSSRDRRGSSRDRRGSSRDRRGSSRDRRGSSRDRRGSSRDRRGSSKERRGSSRERKDKALKRRDRSGSRHRSSFELSNLPSGKDLSDIVDISKKFDRGKVSKSNKKKKKKSGKKRSSRSESDDDSSQSSSHSSSEDSSEPEKRKKKKERKEKKDKKAKKKAKQKKMEKLLKGLIKDSLLSDAILEKAKRKKDKKSDKRRVTIQHSDEEEEETEASITTATATAAASTTERAPPDTSKEDDLQINIVNSCSDEKRNRPPRTPSSKKATKSLLYEIPQKRASAEETKSASTLDGNVQVAKKPVTKTKRVKSSGSKEEGEYSSSGDSDDCGTAKASSKEREKEAPPLPPSSDMVVDKETDATVEDTVEEDKSLMEEVPAAGLL